MDIKTYQKILTENNINNNNVEEASDSHEFSRFNKGDIVLFENSLYEITYIADNRGSRLNIYSHVELLDLQTGEHRSVAFK